MLDEELKIAVDAARLAGFATMRFYNEGFVAEEKIGVDNFSEPVTEADRAASRIIVHQLLSAFPDDGVLSEEEVDNVRNRMSKKRVWVVDPIDGTAGFVKKDGDFAVQIGLAESGRPMLGVVYMPFYDVMIWAVRGQGSFMVETNCDPIGLRVSGKTDLSDMCLAVSKNHLSPRMNRIIEYLGFKDFTRRGSVGVKVGLIANQECDIYIHPSPRTKVWDTCAPQVILEEAGGRLTDLFGQDIDYAAEELQNHDGIVATNGISHDHAIASLAPLLEEFGRSPYRANRPSTVAGEQGSHQLL